MTTTEDITVWGENAWEGARVRRPQAYMTAGGLALAAAVMSVAGAQPAYANTVPLGNSTSGNITVKVPTSVVYTVDGTGSGGQGAIELTTLQDVSMENLSSDYKVSVSKLESSAGGGWNLVKDAEASNQANAVSITYGPEADPVSLADYTDGAALENEAAWTMKPQGRGGSKLEIGTSGKVNNLQDGMDLSNATKIATAKFTLKATEDSLQDRLESAEKQLNLLKQAFHLFRTDAIAGFAPTSDSVEACGVVQPGQTSASFYWWQKA